MYRNQLKQMNRQKKELSKLKQRHKKELKDIRQALQVIAQKQENFLKRYHSKAHMTTSLQVDNALHNINYGKQCILNGVRNLHTAERVLLRIKHREVGLP